ncbi:MAG: septal ring lytic transglycosylase RlpA family protein [Ignavibacteriaceae bacterium]
MKSLTKIFIIFVMVTLVGFTLVVNEETSTTSNPANNEISSVNDAENTINESLLDYTEKGTMVASWYGPRFHGKLTANGEIYDQMAFTAANKKLKFGTLLKITNLKNSKSVIVRINDRGPYIPGRNLDLSKASALALGMMHRGVIKVKVEQISLKGVNYPVVALK